MPRRISQHRRPLHPVPHGARKLARDEGQVLQRGRPHGQGRLGQLHVPPRQLHQREQ